MLGPAERRTPATLPGRSNVEVDRDTRQHADRVEEMLTPRVTTRRAQLVFQVAPDLQEIVGRYGRQSTGYAL